jgi:hypothetical protein
MAPQRQSVFKQLLAAALNVPSADRDSYLDRVCAGDPLLKTELARHLREIDGLRSVFFESAPQPAFALALAGRYLIVRLIGRGGMGEVYEARDSLLNEPIALKTLRADLARGEGVVKRFQRQNPACKLTVALTSAVAGVIPIVEAKQNGGQRQRIHNGPSESGVGKQPPQAP